MRQWSRCLTGALVVAVATAASAADWYGRVERLGVKEAAAQDVALYEKGQLPASLHVGDCLYHLERYEEGVALFRALRRKPDRNYAAAATVREAEGLVKLGRTVEARALFATCLAEFPEAFLDVDIPELCRAWLREIPAAPAPPVEESEREAETRDAQAVREEIRKLTDEIAALRERIAELEKLLAEGD